MRLRSLVLALCVVFGGAGVTGAVECALDEAEVAAAIRLGEEAENVAAVEGGYAVPEFDLLGRKVRLVLATKTYQIMRRAALAGAGKTKPGDVGDVVAGETLEIRATVSRAEEGEEAPDLHLDLYQGKTRVQARERVVESSADGWVVTSRFREEYLSPAALCSLVARIGRHGGHKPNYATIQVDLGAYR